MSVRMSVREMRRTACPRCGGDCPKHSPIHEFTVPSEVDGFTYTHWCLCLALDEPVMLGHVAPRRPAYRMGYTNPTAHGTTTAHISYIDF